VNAESESHEKVAFMVVVKDPWSMENGMLTPTMKIKRNVIEEFYQQKMDAWFAEKRRVVWEF
jgi:long-subunit acyl-CoA synthetase (AMP-forming)